MTIGSFTLTRDSAVLLWAKIVGVAAFLASGALDLKSFGLSETAVHWIMAFSAAITVIAAQLSRSSLPGKADA